jgi:hypothetical protein
MPKCNNMFFFDFYFNKFCLAINIPDIFTLNNWKELMKPIYSKLDASNIQIQTLKKTRDTLLPKLMSGQLRADLSACKDDQADEFKETAV